MVLPACMRNGIRIVSNMGAANPLGGARAARKEAADLGLGDVPVAVVLGDDVSSIVKHRPELKLIENGEPLESILPKMISANAYLGADVVCEALNTGAPIVLSGRVADPSLFLAPMMHEFGWAYDDLPKIAQGTAAGHLLECTASVTGGCFGWPGKKDVPDLARNGFPFADVKADGSIVIGKTPDTGGRLDVMTCTEQLIYEIHDPTAYITPDCVLDITGIALTQEAADRVRVEGARARPAHRNLQGQCRLRRRLYRRGRGLLWRHRRRRARQMGGRDRQGTAEAARLHLRRFPRRPDRHVQPAR